VFVMFLIEMLQILFNAIQGKRKIIYDGTTSRGTVFKCSDQWVFFV